MRTIYKYKLFNFDQVHEIPEGATILSFQIQKETLAIWAFVDTNKPQKKYRFVLVGTGHDVHRSVSDITEWSYVGSVPFPDDFMWHLFYKVEEDKE